MRNIIVALYIMLVAAPSAKGRMILKRAFIEDPTGNAFQFKLPRQPDHVDRSPRQLASNHIVHRAYPWDSDNAPQLPRRPYQHSRTLNQNKQPLTSYREVYDITHPVGKRPIAMQKTPLLDTNAYFEDDVNYDVYRPVQENGGCHHVDEHMIPRPSFPWLHSQYFPRPSQESVHFTRHPYNPLYAGPDYKPAFNSVLMSPWYSGHESFLPASSPEQIFHGSIAYAYIGKPVPNTKPVYEHKTGFIIIANNININHPWPQPVDMVQEHLHGIEERPWINEANGFTNNTLVNDNWGNSIGGQWNIGIRFDHGRDHHIKPGSFSNEYTNIPYDLMSHFPTMSKDTMVTLNTEMSFKPRHPVEMLNNTGGPVTTGVIHTSQSKSIDPQATQNSAALPITTATIQLLAAGEKEHASLETSHQIPKESSMIPHSTENASQQHPMMLPIPKSEDIA